MIARKKFPGSKNNLDALCARFNIDNTKRTKHGALLDTELLVDVYIELLGGKQPSLMSFEKKEDALDAAATSLKRASGKQRPQRVFAPSEAELEAHKELLKSLESPLWNKAS